MFAPLPGGTAFARAYKTVGTVSEAPPGNDSSYPTALNP